MVTYRAYDEIIDFITSSPDPSEVLNFRPPATVIKRVEDLSTRLNLVYVILKS